MKKIDKNQLDLFGPQIWYEYLLVISPDKPVSEAMALRKQKVRSLVGDDASYLNSRAHISLLTFLHTEHEMIMKRVKDVVSRQNSFTVKLNGAAFFEPTPEAKTLYVRVTEKLVIQSLTEKLREIIGRGKKSNPHLTIAGGISSKNHQVINGAIAEFKFDGEFLCEGITVLRRLKDATDASWDFSKELYFSNVIPKKVEGKN